MSAIQDSCMRVGCAVMLDVAWGALRSLVTTV